MICCSSALVIVITFHSRVGDEFVCKIVLGRFTNDKIMNRTSAIFLFVLVLVLLFVHFCLYIKELVPGRFFMTMLNITVRHFVT